MSPTELLAMGRTIHRSADQPNPYRVQRPATLPKFAEVGRPISLLPDSALSRGQVAAGSQPDPPPDADPGPVMRNEDLDDDWRLFPPETTANPLLSPEQGRAETQPAGFWNLLARRLFRRRSVSSSAFDPS